MKLSNKQYDAIKWIALIALPAVSTLYFALAGIWNWPFAEQVTGTIAAICTFLGAICKIASASYSKQTSKQTNEE